MKSKNPVFIVGTERSGSNLLRLILNSHSNIAIPHPPHIMRYFAPLEAGYGDLSDERVFLRLIRDIVALVRCHIYPWDLALDEQEIARSAPSRSVFGVKAALYDQYRRASEKTRWGCKSTFMVDHVDVVLSHYREARFLLLVRDPRDVAASSRYSIFSTFHPYFTACLWRDQQRTALELRSRLPKSSLQLVRYEDMLRDPELAVRSICRFLGEAFESNMLRYFETSEAKRSASLSNSWKNTGVPILAGNFGKYRSELSPEEILLVESIAGVPMLELGYELEHDEGALARVNVGFGKRLRYWREEQRAKVVAELRSLSHDANVWQRWKRDAFTSYVRLRRRPLVVLQQWLSA